MQYCFDVYNPTNLPININGLKKHIENFYTDKFEKLPIITIYSKVDNSVCIILSGKGKKNIEKIEEINNSLSSSDLQFENIQLSIPYIFDVETQQWWDSQNANNKDKKWTSLKQRGPYFGWILEPYKPIGASIIYDNKEYKLTPEEERVASFFAKRLISESKGGVTEEQTKDPVFRENYWNDFKKYLSPEHKKVFKNFNKFNWNYLVKSLEENVKTLSEDEKILKKILTEERKREYGYAFIDGHREKVGNYNVEPAAIFYGRGDNPNRGKIKDDVRPEDVTINIGPKDPVPEPPPGHKWGKIVHDQDAVWLARWNDSITGDIKYVMFNAEGKFKGEGDFLKYEKARKLNKHIEYVRNKYMRDANSSNMQEKQLGTVLFLIDHFGIRVGNEKKEEETDTVGASTLRVNHVRLVAPDHVIFDFLGKDSIRFYKDLIVPKIIFENFKLFLKHKSKDDDVFDRINAKSINCYLKEFDKTFTAKVFRTRLASVIMFNALFDVNIPKDSNKQKTKVLFNKANAKVADVLNHTRTVSKKALECVAKYEEELKEAKKQLKQNKKEGKNTKTIEKKIESLTTKIEAKTDVKNVAITTSLTNYIDPRLVISWCKKQEVEPSTIYTSTLLRKFKWAVSTTDTDWNYITSPLIGNEELEPVEDCEEEPKTKHVEYESEEELEPNPKKSNIILGPGTIDDYKLLLSVCENIKENFLKLNLVSHEVLKWIYPFCVYGLDKGKNVKVNKFIVKFVDKYVFNK